LIAGASDGIDGGADWAGGGAGCAEAAGGAALPAWVWASATPAAVNPAPKANAAARRVVRIMCSPPGAAAQGRPWARRDLHIGVAAGGFSGGRIARAHFSRRAPKVWRKAAPLLFTPTNENAPAV